MAGADGSSDFVHWHGHVQFRALPVVFIKVKLDFAYCIYTYYTYINMYQCRRQIQYPCAGMQWAGMRKEYGIFPHKLTMRVNRARVLPVYVCVVRLLVLAELCSDAHLITDSFSVSVSIYVSPARSHSIEPWHCHRMAKQCYRYHHHHHRY